MIAEAIRQFLAAVVGTVGFSVMFRVPRKYYPDCGVIGGLGSAVAEVLAEKNLGVPLVRHGVVERFGQVGPASFLQKEYHLSADDLVNTVTEALA